jgi:putative tryptophan/tyrosine transport system substrate-binding protein
MRRREFIALLGSAPATWSLGARGQQLAMPVIGFLSSASPGPFSPLLAAFLAALREAGYFEGSNVVIEYRWAEGQYDRLPAMAADLVQHNVAVIVASGGNTPVLAAKAATSTIPIVFTGPSDPVKNGLVASLSRPGGNVTGAALFTTELESKQIEVLRTLVPNAAKIAVLLNPNNTNLSNQISGLDDVRRTSGAQLVIHKGGAPAEIDAAFAAMAEQHADALLVGADPYFNTVREQITFLAARYKLPTMYTFPDLVVAGGLISYGNSLADNYRKCAGYVARILKGEKPTDLPILQPTKFDLTINLKTAKSLGLQIPDKLLALADEVIE